MSSQGCSSPFQLLNWREEERETGNKVEQRRADERDWNKAELSIPVPTFGFG